jgi:hypothetical protein
MAKGGGRKYARDKNGRFASTGTTAKGGRLGGKKGSINLGKQRPGTSAPGGGTIAKGGNGVRGTVARRTAGINGYGKGSKASAAPASAASAGKRKIRMGANQPGVSAPQGTIAKGRTSGMMARVKGKVMGYGKGSTATPAPAPKAKAKKGPKTAAGRASANLRNAQKQLAKNPLSKKAAMSEVTARAAAEVYKARGTGRKGAAKRKK